MFNEPTNLNYKADLVQMTNLPLFVMGTFNGISMGRIALAVAKIPVSKYISSEVDFYAKQIALKHWPDDLEKGDILKWREWDIEWKDVDLLIGGSPCQGFSQAGEKGGTKAIIKGRCVIVDSLELYLEMKEKGADFLSQSYLFWEYVALLEHIQEARRIAWKKPAKFMLENVKMTKANELMITNALGVKPVLLDSAKFSPQGRERLYWCNWKVSQPVEETKAVLKDVLFDIDGNRPCELRKGSTPSARNLHHVANATDIKGNESIKRVYGINGKCPTLTTMQGGHREPKFLMPNGLYRKATIIELERIAGLPDNYTAGISDTQRKKVIGNGWEVNTIAYIFSQM